MSPPQYASKLPAGSRNHITNIAILGAGGQVGSHLTAALLQTGLHNITAITRPNSTNTLPAGLTSIKKASLDNHASLVTALQNQQVLIITLPAAAPRDSQSYLIDAAIEAGVTYIMPNEYGVDCSNDSLAQDVLLGAAAQGVRKYIHEKSGGKTYFVPLTCSFWYEYSLAGAECRYGFDFHEKSLTLFDEGSVPITTTTWPQCGRAVAKVFSLPIWPEDENDNSLTLSQFHDQAILIKSFTLSQRDMLASVLRVTGDSESDWTITHEPSKERYFRGKEMLSKGEMVGFAMQLYTRVFWPNGGGNFSHKVVNEQLGLPEEDLDEFTRVAIKMSEENTIWPRLEDRKKGKGVERVREREV